MEQKNPKKTLYARGVEPEVEHGLRLWALELNLSLAGLLKALVEMKKQIKPQS